MITFESAFLQVRDLVADFQEGWTRYMDDGYNEAQLRKRFIDSFFKALGWDVDQIKNKNPYMQEVWVELSTQVDGVQRKPDYTFSVAPHYGDSVFYVEAKRSQLDIAEEADAIHQINTYGWRGKTPIGILTNFRELILVDCRYRPDIRRSFERRIEIFTLEDYLNEQKFARIYYLLARDEVAEGSLLRRAATLPKPRGKSSQGRPFTFADKTVDEAFLDELQEHRLALASAFAIANPDLGGEALTECTQRVLDRLVFIRFLEDRGILNEYLVSEFGVTTSVWKDFIATCRDLNSKYNGVVFRSHFVDSTRFNPPDDHLFAEVCSSLSNQNTDYDFQSIPIHILGSIYERFLGSEVVRTDKGVTIRKKPELQKAGGVYYTPSWVVNYIVRATVYKRIANKTPEELQNLRIADIACGSGSFLISVFDALLTHHRQFYQEHPNLAKKSGCKQVDGVWHLTLPMKKQILLNCVFGVDKDPQAVEVTELSLYLKLLEHESAGSARQLSMLGQKILPDLSSNIKHGNSLIENDVATLGLSEDELRSMRPFNLLEEFGGRGFDIIVGNPPYVRQEIVLGEVKPYMKRYAVYTGTADLYSYFIERGLEVLNTGGELCYIVANKWLLASYGAPLRRFLTAHRIVAIVDFGDMQVFDGATTYTCILHLEKSPAQSTFSAARLRALNFPDLERALSSRWFNISTSLLSSTVGWNVAPNEVQKLLNKLQKKSKTLGEVFGKETYRGVVTGANEAFVIDEATKDRLIREDPRAAELIKPYMAGRDVTPFQQLKIGKYLIFTRRGIDIEQYSSIKNYLARFRARLEPRPRRFQGEWQGRKSGNYQWYEIQDSTAYYPFFETPKILYLVFQTKPAFSYDASGIYPNNAIWIIPNADKWLLGILNSQVSWFFISHRCTLIRGGYQLIGDYFHNLPLPAIGKRSERLLNELSAIVDRMIHLHSKLSASLTDSDITYYQKQVELAQRQLDDCVFTLYGLTENEVSLLKEEMQEIEGLLAESPSIPGALESIEITDGTLSDAQLD